LPHLKVAVIRRDQNLQAVGAQKTGAASDKRQTVRAKFLNVQQFCYKRMKDETTEAKKQEESYSRQIKWENINNIRL
jgi:hypothetical protein